MTETTTTPAAPNRQSRRKQKTRMKLLEAANQVFLEKGIENTTVTDITETADMAYGTFYNYFKSVSDVVPVVAEEILRKCQQEIKTLQEQYDDPAMKIAVSIHALFKGVMSDPATNWLTQKPNIMVEELARVATDDAIEDMRKGVESGSFRLPAGALTLKTFCTWAFTGVMHEASKDPEQLQQYTQDMTLLYLRILGVDDQKAQEMVKVCAELN
ncbi:TetR/AcrR family transcriptional regulator [Maricurvus nonylphenolicus]|uniref:TetR/AcrR family transcriptional regulator n=1 Tax=Maricurvus nonylphenolicus TaxID=1008307 RepID=UPI0036F37929